MNVPLAPADCPFERTPTSSDVSNLRSLRQPNKAEYPKATLAIPLLFASWARGLECLSYVGKIMIVGMPLHHESSQAMNPNAPWRPMHHYTLKSDS